jgi:hypothetical protein
MPVHVPRCFSARCLHQYLGQPEHGHDVRRRYAVHRLGHAVSIAVACPEETEGYENVVVKVPLMTCTSRLA